MGYLRASITLLTLVATLLGGQTLFRCLMADGVTLNVCHCPTPKTAAKPVLDQADGDCCLGLGLPTQLSATSTSLGIVVQAPTAIIAQLPRPEREAQLLAGRAECRDSRALAPPLYQKFCRILI